MTNTGHPHSAHSHSAHTHSGSGHEGHTHSGTGHGSETGHEGHSHAPKVSADNEKKMLLALSLTVTFLIVEAVGGWLSGSLALIADAGHMLTDSMALGLAYAAFRVGRKAADSRRTFGYLRTEVIAGLINAFTLFAIVVWIVIEAIKRFQNPSEVLAGPMLAVAVVGLLVNCIVLWILSRGDKDHVNVKGAMLHVMGDLLGSVGAIVAAIIIYFTDWTPVDPILSVLVSLLILRSAWSLMHNSTHILLEGAPDSATPEAIEQYLMSNIPNLLSVSHIHVWSITSGKVLATLDITPDQDSAARMVSERVSKALMDKFGIEHSTIGIEWPDQETNNCSLNTKFIV